MEDFFNNDSTVRDTDSPTQDPEGKISTDTEDTSDVKEDISAQEKPEVTNETAEVTNETTEVTNEPAEVTKETAEVTKEPAEVTNETTEVANEPAGNIRPDDEYVPATSTNTPPRQKIGGQYMTDGRYVFPDGYYYDVYDNYRDPFGMPVNDYSSPLSRLNIGGYEELDANAELNRRNEKKFKRVRVAITIVCIIFGLALVLLCGGLISNIIYISDPTHNRPEVNITVSDKGPTSVEDRMATPETLERAKSSVVIVQTTRIGSSGVGTGFIITSDGYIITNHHVIENAQRVTVTLYSGKEYSASIIGYDELNDIAVIKISADDLPVIELGQSKYCYTGERVYAIGTPASVSFGWSVSMGIISHPTRDFDMYNDNNEYTHTMKLIQTDTSVNHGNSGGPLINVRGEVIGIITLGLSDTTGIYFAIPIDTALPIVERIMEDGGANNPMLGIICTGVTQGAYYYVSEDDTITKVSAGTAAQYPDECFYAPVTGIYVMSFNEKYNAKDVLRKGDIICEMGGYTVSVSSDVTQVLLKYKAGDKLSMKVYRNGEYIDVEITLMKK